MKEQNKLKRELIEKIGVIYEIAGHTHMTGRVVGLLLLAEPPFKSFESIVEELNASKSSISNTLKLLISMGLVEYITFTGDRKRYFKIKVSAFESMLYKETENLRNYIQLLKKVQELRSDVNEKFNNDLKRFISFFELVEREYPIMIKKWKEMTE